MAKLSDIKLNRYEGTEIRDTAEQNVGNPIEYVATKAAQGFTRSIEGMVDFVSGIGPGIYGAISGNEGAKDFAKNVFTTDWFDYSAVDKQYNPSAGMQFVGEVASGIGNSLPSLLTAGAAGVASGLAGLSLSEATLRGISLTALGYSATGNAIGEAINKTGEFGGKELGYGLLSGLTEVGTEAIGDALGLGTGRVMKSMAGRFATDATEAISKSTAWGIVKSLGGDFLGEGFEEGLSAILEPAWGRITGVDPNADWNWGDIGYQALIGGLSGVMMGAAHGQIDAGRSIYYGKKAMAEGKTDRILDVTRNILENGKTIGVSDKILETVQDNYDQYMNAVSKANGKTTVRQQMLLGNLTKLNTAAMINPLLQKEALNILQNAEVVAEQYSAFMKDSEGNPVRITAADIRKGVNLKETNQKTLNKQIRDALMNNQKLQGIAIMSFAGKLYMQTDAWVKYASENPGAVTDNTLSQFIETASEAEKAELGRMLGIQDWNKVSAVEVNRAFERNSDTIQKAVSSAESAKAAAKGERNAAPNRFTKKVKDGAYDLGDGYVVVKSGDSYRVYNEQKDTVTRELSARDVNALMNQKVQETAQNEENETVVKADEVARRVVPDYDKLSESVKRSVRMTIRQAAEYKVSTADMELSAKLSAKSGLNIVFSRDALTLNKRDSKGNLLYANGQYNMRNTIYLNPDLSQIGKTGNIMLHELGHWLYNNGGNKIAMLHYATAALEDSKYNKVVQQYVDFYKSMGETEEQYAEKVFDEIQAAYAEELMTDDDFWNKLLADDPKLKRRVPAFMRKWADRMDMKQAKTAAEAYSKIYQDAFRRLSSLNQGSNAFEYSKKKDGSTEFRMSLASYFASGRKDLYKYLVNQYGKDDAKQTIEAFDDIARVAQNMIKNNSDLQLFSNWSDTNIEFDENGHPIFSTSVKNGEYELNQDFSRVCKKRRHLDMVLNYLATNDNFRAENLKKSDFLKINRAIKAHGFEIACDLCFVDAKRYRQAEWAKTFTETYNDILKSVIVGDTSNFDFINGVMPSDDGVQIDPDKPVTFRKWEEGRVKETVHYDSLDDLIQNEGNANDVNIAKLIRDNPELRHWFVAKDIISSNGFDNIQRTNRKLRGILDGWGGSSVPKPSAGDTVYDNSVLLQGKYKPETAFAMGGMRMNSFSDFMAHMFFDYCQAFADAEAKGLPIQAYTKELLFIRLYGKTGGKFNMSGIPAVMEGLSEKNEAQSAGLDIRRLAEHLGKDINEVTEQEILDNLDYCDYVWAKESINMDNAILLQTGILYDRLTSTQKRKALNAIREGNFDQAFAIAGEENVDREYAKHCGTIVVGVSKAHILKLLRDNTIRMVIPYHKSGLNPEIAKLMHISAYADYTKKQNTSSLKKGKEEAISLTSKKIPAKYKIKDFDFYEFFGKTIDGVLYDGKRTAQAYLDWCDKGRFDKALNKYVYDLTDGGLITADELHKEYRVVPKFEEFRREENYYKVLEDFDVYDTITNKHSPQEAIHFLQNGSALPEDYKKILLDALKAEQKDITDFEDELYNNVNGLQDEIMKISKKAFVASEETERRNSLPDNIDPDVRYSLTEEEINGIIEQAKSNVEGIFNEIAIRQGISTTTGENASRSRRGYDANSYASENGYADVHTIEGLRQLCESGEQGVSVALRDDICREMVSGIFTKIGRLTLDERMIYRSVVRAAEGTSDFTYNSIWHEVVFPRCYTAEMLTTREINNKLGISTGYYFGYPVRRGWRDEIMYNLGYTKPGEKAIFIRADQETADGVVQTIPDVATVEAGAPSLTGRHERMHILAKLTENSSSDLIGSITKMKLASHGLGTSIKDFSKTMDTLLGYTVLRWGDRGDAYNYNEEIMAELYAGTIKLSDKKAQAYIDKLVANIDKAIDNEPINGMRFSLPDNIDTLAKEHFGTTTNWKETGYLLKDGTQLDFSGRHWGGTERNTRQVDHADIQEVVDGNYGYKKVQIAYVNEGNIRIIPETPGINLSVAPTEEQYAKLRAFINRFRYNGFMVDYDDEKGYTVYSKEYDAMTSADTIIADIKDYFENGKPIEQSDVAMFHEEGRYSLAEDYHPKKTIEVYKLMRYEDGKLYPLFIDQSNEIQIGKWYKADSPNLDILKKMPAGVFLVDYDSGTYESIDEYCERNGIKERKLPTPEMVDKATEEGKRWMHIVQKESAQRRFGGEKRSYYNLGVTESTSKGKTTRKVEEYSMRPGWHAGSLPSMQQIPDTNAERTFVWVRGEMPADIDYQAEAESNPDKDIPDHIPEDGYYMKATNANAKASQADRIGWYVAGAFKANEIISYAEAREVIDQWNEEHPGEKVEYDFDRLHGRDYNKATGRIESVSGDEGRYSIPDSDYLKAVEANDTKALDWMVEQAARANGYDSPKLYHGTDSFGFTRPDVNAPGGDGFSFWATDSKATASSYTEYGEVRGITEELTEESLEKLTEKAEEDIDDEVSHFCSLIDKYFSEWFFGYSGGESYVKEIVLGANPEAGYGNGVYDKLLDLVIDAYDKYGDRYNYEEFYEFQEDSKEFEELERSIVVLEGLYRRYDALVNKNYDELVGGIYQLYGNTDGFYVVEGNGADWNNLPHEGRPKISRYGVEDAAWSTRDYSLWARDNGYKGILFKNIHDNGRYGLSGIGNVYAFFEPLSQVRSADPVTYDDQGNVIPLSERFNTKKDDFRWSLPEDDLKEAKRIKKLAEQQSERATERLQKSRKLVQDNTAANKATNRVLDLAQKLKEYVTKRKYVSSSVLANPLLDAWAKELGKLKYRSDIRKASARKILVGFSQFYNKNNDVLTDYYKSMNQEMDANVLGALELLKKNIADKNVNFKPLSLEELQAAEVILGAADALFRNFDTVVVDGKRELTQDLATKEIEILQSGDPKEYKKFVKAMLLAQKYLNNATDPRAVIKWLEHYDENGILTKLFKSITDGETASMKQNVVFMTPFEDFLKKHKKYSKILAETKIALDAISGQVNLTVGQAIALYELTKREQAQRGLVESGVSFADDNGLTKSARFFGEGKYSEEEIKKYAEQIRDKVAQHLTAEDMEFIGLVEDFFNNQSKAVKTEADMELYGYTNALEEFYYPIKRAASTIATSFSNVQSLMADIAAMNTFSFNKDTVKNARNQLYLNSVYDTVQQHARLMSVYANMYKALEAFSRVMNRNIGTSTEVTSVRKYLQEHVWADSETYLKKLMADIQGVKNEQLGDKLWGGLRGAFAKAQLGANLKVIFAQTASLPTAMTILSPSSIAYGITHKVNFKDLDRYSDWAMVRNHEQAIVKAEGVVDKVGKVGDMLSKPIQWTDRLTIGLLWNACQAEVKKTKGLEIGTEENKIEAAKLLESVGRDTQPNYTNTERSGMMRGNQFLKTLTMFTSAPLKQVSRFLEAAGEFSYALKTKNKTKIHVAGKKLRKTLAAILLANMMYCLIGQFFTWLYKKDRKNKAGEEISFAQDYFTDVAGTTIGMFPVAKSVFDYFNKGYDLSSFDFDIINDILNTTGDIVGLVEKAASGEQVERSDFGSALRSTVYSASQLAGIPTKNVMNTVTGLFKRFDPEVAYGMDSFFYGQDYRKDLNAYVAEGNEKMSNLLMDLYTKENTGTMSKDAQKTLLNLYTQGYDVLPKSIGNKISYSYKDENGDTQTESFTLNAQQKKQFKAIYSEATPVIEAMLDSKAFQKLSEENQAKAIRSVNNAYYIKAKNAVTETATANSLLTYFPKDTGKYATILAGLSDVTADTDKKGNVINGTKKQNVYKYLTSNGLTKNEALYVMAVKGYSLKNLPVSEANARKMLLKYILSLPVSQSEKAAIAEHCGFTVKGNRIISKNG